MLLIFSVLATIPGPKSPTTTKNAMQVPIRNPMMHNSTTVLPGGPNVWKAMREREKYEAILTPITSQTSELFNKLSYEELTNVYRILKFTY